MNSIYCHNQKVEETSSPECITPSCDELNYETSQISCPHRDQNPQNEKCQKLFKNIMALNVHLQMYHKETGIITASNKYLTRQGRYHCPVKTCIFFCQCLEEQKQSLSFSNFNAVRLHFLRQHGLKKEQCGKCSKSFGLHQDLIAHEKICGVDCPFSCSICQQQFQNRTSLRRHQLKSHPIDLQNEQSPSEQSTKNLSGSSSLTREHQQKLNSHRHRRRPLPPNQIEFARQTIPSSSHQTVTINPMALELLKSFRPESKSIVDSMPSDSGKATQTYTRVSVGTECCSLTNSETTGIRTTSIRNTAQKSSQTPSRVRICKTRTRYSSKKMNNSTNTDEENSTIHSTNISTNVFNASTMTHWDEIAAVDMQTQISMSFQTQASMDNVGAVSNILQNSCENNHSVIVQTLPISMTSTQMQTISDYLPETNIESYSTPDPLPPYQESVGTSCFFDEFLFDDFSQQNQQDSSVLFDFDAMDLLDLIDNGTQTNPLISSHETQTINDWNPMILSEDEWMQTMTNN